MARYTFERQTEKKSIGEITLNRLSSVWRKTGGISGGIGTAAGRRITPVREFFFQEDYRTRRSEPTRIRLGLLFISGKRGEFSIYMSCIKHQMSTCLPT
jgi:hypothetical protein